MVPGARLLLAASMVVGIPMLASCADKDADTMTCQQYYDAGNGAMSETSSKQRHVIETLLGKHDLDSGAPNVSIAAFNIQMYCGIGLEGPDSSAASLRIADMPAWSVG